MFERLDSLIGKENREALASKTVVIIGVGGVGGYAVEALTRSGIGHFVLIDHDIVDITNKNRQIIALESTIGKKKVEVLKSRMQDINPNCIIDTYDIFLDDNNFNLLNQYNIDFLIDACDTVNTKKLLLNECIKKNIPFISSMGTANKLDPSKLEITDIRKTNYDPLAKIMRKYVKDQKIKNKITVVSSSEQPHKTQNKILGSTSFVPSSAGLLIASYVVKNLISDN